MNNSSLFLNLQSISLLKIPYLLKHVDKKFEKKGNISILFKTKRKKSKFKDLYIYLE